MRRRLGALFLIPMATSLAYGVVFATAISLFIVPCAYLILDDLSRLFESRGERRRGSLEVVQGSEAVAGSRARA